MKVSRVLEQKKIKRAEDPKTKCPFCSSMNTEPYSLFGSLLSTSQYYCRNCRTVFEWIKWEAKEA